MYRPYPKLALSTKTSADGDDCEQQRKRSRYLGEYAGAPFANAYKRRIKGEHGEYAHEGNRRRQGVGQHQDVARSNGVVQVDEDVYAVIFDAVEEVNVGVVDYCRHILAQNIYRGDDKAEQYEARGATPLLPGALGELGGDSEALDISAHGVLHAATPRERGALLRQNFFVKHQKGAASETRTAQKQAVVLWGCGHARREAP